MLKLHTAIYQSGIITMDTDTCALAFPGLFFFPVGKLPSFLINPRYIVNRPSFGQNLQWLDVVFQKCIITFGNGEAAPQVCKQTKARKLSLEDGLGQFGPIAHPAWSGNSNHRIWIIAEEKHQWHHMFWLNVISSVHTESFQGFCVEFPGW